MFDSMCNDTTSDMVNQIYSIVWSQKKSVTIAIMDVLKQHAWLCILWPFALAFSTSLYIGEQPSKKRCSNKDLRAHLYIHNYSLFDGDIPTIISFF